MDSYKSLTETTLSYFIDTNKQMYDFGLKMAKDYAEFTKATMKMVPGMDAWTQLVPNTTSKK
jgi:hypothetical protein